MTRLAGAFESMELHRPPRTKRPIVCQVVADQRAREGRPAKFLAAVLSAQGLWPDDVHITGTDAKVVSSFVLLVGKEAMKLWSHVHPTLTIARTRGVVGLWELEKGPALVMPIMHPESVLLGKNQMLKQELFDDVRYWAGICLGEMTIDEGLARPHACADCGGINGPVVRAERDGWLVGVPWCEKCARFEELRIKKMKQEGKKVRVVDGKGKYVAKTRIGEDQGRLL